MTKSLRSLLFAPAVRPDLLRKLPRSGADGVVIDCEDATPSGFKEEGRRNALEVGGDLVAEGANVFVRVNGADTPWFAEDVVSGVPDGAAGVVLPMIETLEQLDRIESLIQRTGRAGLPVIAGLETALGVATARQLLDHRVVTGAYFGAEDFIADMGGRRTDSNVEVLYARAEVALAGRLAGIPVLDQVVVAYRDDARFTREANEARAMGFAGKLCIHPAQVELAHAVFTPSADEVRAAKALVAAAEEASRSGSGVIVVDGRMIDGPLVEQARSVIAAAE